MKTVEVVQSWDNNWSEDDKKLLKETMARLVGMAQLPSTTSSIDDAVRIIEELVNQRDELDRKFNRLVELLEPSSSRPPAKIPKRAFDSIQKTVDAKKMMDGEIGKIVGMVDPSRRLGFGKMPKMPGM